MLKRRDPYAALADPTRRAILTLLRRRGSCPAGGIAAEFHTVSRAAISKHLGVLREAGLVTATDHGRERHYTLDAAPLAAVYAELEQFAPLWEASLAALKRQVEGQPAPEDKQGA